MLVLAALAAAGAVLLALPASAQAEPTQSVDYLYIQANEGSSSGGHAALRIGDWTYHFQHQRGLLRMQRDPWSRFEHVYRTLENRGIAVSRVAVSEETWERLRRGFQRRYLVENRRLELLADLEEDVRLLEALRDVARAAPARPGYALRGAGFFADGAAAAGPALAALRERIERLHGPGFLAGRRRALAAKLAARARAPPDPDQIELAPGRYPAGVDSFSRRYAELWSGLAALALLERPRALAPDGLLEAGPLDSASIRQLHGRAEALSEALARLAASPRPDWGRALLLGMARLAALEQSLATGRLVLLDALPAAAEELPIDARRRAVLPRLLAEAEDDWSRARERALGAAEARELDWSELELATARREELRRALAGAPALRIHFGAALPEGRARLRDLPLPAASAAELEARLEEARAAARGFRAALRFHQGYHLITRNCVSELFRSVDAALAGDGEAPAEVSQQRLGGHIDPVAGLNFVPFVSSQRVRARYTVSETRWLPSFRRFQLAELARREPAWRVALRESNTFTSTLYAPSARDGFFVFFTDGPAPLRPLLGAGNLLGALGWSGAGLALAPFDRGRALRAGLEGALFSLPELLFVNLRKGSNEYVPPELRPPPG